MKTFAEGIATRVPFAMTVDLLRDRLDDFRLVGEGAIRAAMRDLLVEESLIAEGAAAASVAAIREMRDELRGETVVLPVSGRNVDAEKLRAVLSE
jgi:threonine dehydratase